MKPYPRPYPSFHRASSLLLGLLVFTMAAAPASHAQSFQYEQITPQIMGSMSMIGEGNETFPELAINTTGSSSGYIEVKDPAITSNSTLVYDQGEYPYYRMITVRVVITQPEDTYPPIGTLLFYSGGKLAAANHVAGIRLSSDPKNPAPSVLAKSTCYRTEFEFSVSPELIAGAKFEIQSNYVAPPGTGTYTESAPYAGILYWFYVKDFLPKK